MTAPAAAPAPVAGNPATRIAVRSVNRIVIVPVAAILRLDAEDNYVRLWADRTYLHKETLTALMARLDPASFVRVHRSHAMALSAVRELTPLAHGEFALALADGATVTSGRSYRADVLRAFELG
ncbi:MAG: LytTR family DNA-binding domain-containing protein [Betaproteobacteria bacterium]